MKFLLSFALLISTFIYAQKKTEVKTIYDFWNETEISSGLIETFVNDESCYENEQNFVACMEVLQLIFDIETNKVKKQTGVSFKDLYLQSIVAKNCDVTLCTSRNTGWSIKASKKRRLNYLEFFNRGFKFSFSFDNELKIYLDSLKKHEPHEFKKYIADVFNTYLSIALDPHTRIKPRYYTGEQPSALPGKVSYSSGISFILTGKDVKVTRVEKGSPAYKAGIVAGDIIVSPGQEDLTKLLQGYYLEKKSLTLRSGLSTKSIEITFGPADKDFFTKNIESEIITRSDQVKVGYIKIYTFSDKGVCSTVKMSLQNLESTGVDKLVLDLRNNGGGYIHQAVCLAGFFLGKHKVVSHELNLDGDIIYTQKTFTNKVYTGEIILLLNGFSASSSELLSAALIEHKRAITVGTKSYGKGTYQSPSYDFDKIVSKIKGSDSNSGGIQKVLKSILNYLNQQDTNKDITFYQTQGLFLTPNKRSVQVHGIIPNVALAEYDYESRKRKFKRQNDLYLYPLNPGQPMSCPANSDCVQDQTIECLSSKSQQIKSTINMSSPKTFLLDKQLAQSLFIFECYPQD